MTTKPTIDAPTAGHTGNVFVSLPSGSSINADRVRMALATTETGAGHAGVLFAAQNYGEAPFWPCASAQDAIKVRNEIIAKIELARGAPVTRTIHGDYVDQNAIDGITVTPPPTYSQSPPTERPAPAMVSCIGFEEFPVQRHEHTLSRFSSPSLNITWKDDGMTPWNNTVRVNAKDMDNVRWLQDRILAPMTAESIVTEAMGTL